MTGPHSGAVAAALAHVATRSDGPPVPPGLRVTVHFHPDRVDAAGRTVIEQLAADEVYRTQFETGTSNGGLTAHPGGDRWQQEQRLFGGAYDHAEAALRPVYGSLNHRCRAEGGSIRFGSAHLQLTAEAIDRCTFCYPDSVFAPTAVGTAARMGLTALADADRRDRLDDYVEAHLHGGLRLEHDVEAVVLDPAFRDTPVAGPPQTCRPRSSGTGDSGCRSAACCGTATTAASRPWRPADRSRATGCWTRRSSARRPGGARTSIHS